MQKTMTPIIVRLSSADLKVMRTLQKRDQTNMTEAIRRAIRLALTAG